MKLYICDECKKPIDDGKRYTKLSDSTPGIKFISQFSVDVVVEGNSMKRTGDFHEPCLQEHLALFAEQICKDVLSFSDTALLPAESISAELLGAVMEYALLIEKPELFKIGKLRSSGDLAMSLEDLISRAQASAADGGFIQ
jgi:hypothetical protein